MIDILQTILLIFILWFIVTRNSDWIARLLGKQRRLILDSCALIDGRIVEIVNSGFVAGELIIPQFILNELQGLADGHDSHKRERARFGLDIAHQLQDSAPNRVTVDRSVIAEAVAIDDKLILLARKLKAQLYTTDYNLAKVAAVQDVRVLNVNELAQNLRPITLPGETLEIKIIQKGSNRDQGVGYLEDGTMIVVSGAARHVGRTVPVTVTRMHQTMAGKMVFGQVREARSVAADAPASSKKQAHDDAATDGQKAQVSLQPQTKGKAASQPTPGRLHSRLSRSLRRRAVQ